MCILIRNIFFETLVKICVTKHKCRLFLWYFFRHRTMFLTYPNKESQITKIHIFCHAFFWNKTFWRLIFWVFSYILDNNSWLNSCVPTKISTKLSLIACLINVHILICRHAKCDCRLWKFLWASCTFLIFIYYWCLKSYITSVNF